jgi:hypothetical protein
VFGAVKRLALRLVEALLRPVEPAARRIERVKAAASEGHHGRADPEDDRR